jgi:hypothetical protein
MKVTLILSNVFDFNRKFSEINCSRDVIAIEIKMLIFEFLTKLEHIR